MGGGGGAQYMRVFNKAGSVCLLSALVQSMRLEGHWATLSNRGLGFFYVQVYSC